MHALPRLWRETDFRWLFLSQTISTTGDRIVLVALALLVTERTGSTTDLGIVVAAQTAALVTFLLIGGVWADRLPRHRIMVSTDLIRGALHALLAILIFADALSIWQLVVIEVCFGAAEAFFRPAYSGLVPQTVPEELIQEANAANGFTQTVAEFAGPAIATVLVLTLGTGAAFAIDAGTFLLSAGLLALVRPRERGERRRAHLAADRAARRLAGSALARVGVGHDRRLRLPPRARLRARTSCSGRPSPPSATAIPRCGAGSPRASGSAPLPARCWRCAGGRWRRSVTGILATVPFGARAAGVLARSSARRCCCRAPSAAGVGLALFGVWWETALAQRIPPDGAVARRLLRLDGLLRAAAASASC